MRLLIIPRSWRNVVAAASLLPQLSALPFLAEQCAPVSESLVEFHQLPLLELEVNGGEILAPPPGGATPAISEAQAREIVGKHEIGQPIHQAVLATLNNGTNVPAIVDRLVWVIVINPCRR